MTRLAFMVIMLTSTLTGILLAREVKSQNISEAKVSIDLNKAELREIFQQLEKQSGFRFYYDYEIGSMKGITLKENTTLDVVLKKLANLKHLHFTQQNSLIAVTKSPLPLPPPPPGSIKGRVVEFETSEPLPGASVRIIELNEGAASDEKGFYHINNIPPGKYTLQISYIGFETYLQPDVIVKEGKALSLDIKLKASASLKEVTVSGAKYRVRSVTAATDKDVLTEIKNATGVISGISNEQILKTPDRNAAEVVKRISGVTVVDDRFIIVRGMNQRYNLTYLNDNIAPSTELYNKAFAYDLIPSSIIDRILVYKSPQADLFGDFAGGAVKIFTKNAKPVRHLDIGIQLADRPGSTLTSINTYNGGKFDFLGFDDGTRKLPSFSPSYFQSNQNTRVADQSELLKGFTPTLNYGTKKSTPDLQLFANYYDNWKIGKARLFDLTSINYTHETKNYDVYNQTGNTNIYRSGFEAGQQDDVNNQVMNSQQSTEIGKISLLQNFLLKLNSNNKLEFKNFFVNEGRVLTTVNTSRENDDPLLEFKIQNFNTINQSILLSFQQRLLYAGNLDGEHDFDHKKQQLNWDVGYTYILQNTPDQRNSYFSNSFSSAFQSAPPNPGFVAIGSNTGSASASMLGMINRLFTRFDENTYNASLDYTYHIGPQFSIKAGTFQLYKTREVGRRIFRVNRAGLAPGELQTPTTDGSPPGWPEGYGVSNPNLIYFRESDLNSVWSSQYFPNDGSGLAIYDATSPIDSYVATEQNSTGYLMADLRTPDGKLTVNGGLRVEYDRQKVAGAIIDTSRLILALKVDHPKTSFLPSVNINYRPDSLYVVRFGYGRTVNRPDFREITPYNDFDYANNQTIIGNTNVTSATIDNFDLRAEFYPKSAAQNEVFNAGIFYKNLQNPIEQLRYQNNNGDFTGNPNFFTFGNAVSANIYGVEAEVKKSLSFIPLKFFKDLSVVANGALIKSTTRQRDYGGYIYANDTTNIKGRPLQGQSPYVINAGLYYENAGTGTKIGLIYNVNGPRIYAKSTANPNTNLNNGPVDNLNSVSPDLLQLPQQLLDFTLTQRLVKSLQLKFSIQNLLNQEFRIVEDRNYNQKYDPEVPHLVSSPGNPRDGSTYYTGDNIFQQYKPGRYFIIQFTYAFN